MRYPAIRFVPEDAPHGQEPVHQRPGRTQRLGGTARRKNEDVQEDERPSETHEHDGIVVTPRAFHPSGIVSLARDATFRHRSRFPAMRSAIQARQEEQLA